MYILLNQWYGMMTYLVAYKIEAVDGIMQLVCS